MDTRKHDELLSTNVLPLPPHELANKDTVRAALFWREVRITISPIASCVFEFYSQGKPPVGPEMYRKVEMRSSGLSSENPMNLTTFRCDKSDSHYYSGRAIAEFRPLGQVDGVFTFVGIVEGLLSGDSIGFRYLYDDVLGGKIKVEVFRSEWDTIVYEGMTNAGKRVLLNF